MRVGLVIVAALALGGCKSAVERQAAKTAEADGFCAGIGARPGSDAYVQCRLQLRAEEERRYAANAAHPAFTPTPIIAPGSNRLDCRSQNEFGAIRTTCN